MLQNILQQISEPQIESPIHTKNSKLNSVLAETARNFQPLKKTDNLAELLDGGFDKIGEGIEEAYTNNIIPQTPQASQVEPDGSNIEFLKSMVSSGVTTGQQESVLGTDAVPDTLKGVFNKNFKAVMKKIDEQKKYGNQGLIDPRSIFSG